MFENFEKIEINFKESLEKIWKIWQKLKKTTILTFEEKNKIYLKKIKEILKIWAKLKIFIQNLKQFAKYIKNKICRNYKVYCFVLVTGFYFFADHRQPLEATGLQNEGLNCPKLG